MAGCVDQAHPAITPPADSEQKISGIIVLDCAHTVEDPYI